MFFSMLILFYSGIRLRKYMVSKDQDLDDKNMGVAEGSLLGLLALLLSFTFSMSSSRHDKRINIIVEEANNIGTAILRADLYPDSIRKAFRHDFKDYVASRIEFFDAGSDIKRINRSLDESYKIQQKLWKRATTLGQEQANFHRTSQMVPALNAMFDIVTTRNAANVAKVPELILYLLFLLCCTSALTLGYSIGKKPDWIVMVGFAGMIAMTIYLIVDLDRPRRGIITMKDMNMNVINLKTMFDESD
jgi:hypothetical protein